MKDNINNKNELNCEKEKTIFFKVLRIITLASIILLVVYKLS